MYIKKKQEEIAHNGTSIVELLVQSHVIYSRCSCISVHIQTLDWVQLCIWQHDIYRRQLINDGKSTSVDDIELNGRVSMWSDNNISKTAD